MAGSSRGLSVSRFEKLTERWHAINDLERTSHAQIEEHSRRDLSEQPWTDEDRYFAAIRTTHLLAKLARVEDRQKVIFDAAVESSRYAELTRWLVISAGVGAIIGAILH